MPNLVLKTNITIKKPYGLKICVFMALLCGAYFRFVIITHF